MDEPAELFEQVVARLLNESHLMSPDELPRVVASRLRPLGVRAATIYLVDQQQGWLRPVPPADSQAVELSVDATLAGLAYQRGRTQVSEAGPGDVRLWLPLIDGSDRVGVLAVDVESAAERTVAQLEVAASLVALLIVSKESYSDTIAQVRRRQPVQVQAELEWAFMPPLSLATPEVTINAALEPAHAVGGDAFDYALLGDRLHLAVIDATGHDLTAGLVAIAAIAACRSTRRAGGDLQRIADRADLILREQFGSRRFATALLCEFDVRTGVLTWMPCGHPPPLLIRGSKTLSLAQHPRPPLGVLPIESRSYLHRQRLQPGDRLICYTDGVTEARDADGREFGVERLADFVNLYAGEGMTPAEALRRLTRAVLAHQNGKPADDATILQLQWRPPDSARQLSVR